ncbi:MAG TPA: type 4a pilus biogenesis protein PilO [Acidimicrobiales bacterium]|nr:type 4a pilus biogenesis protein PilO [Acidimicrobiales bacterium]
MNRRAWLFAGLASLLVLALWYFFLWSPRNDDLEKAKDRTEAAQSTNRDLESRIQRLKAAQRDEPRLRARLERLRTAIPDEPKLAELIIDVNDAAVRSGIDFLSIAPARPAVAAPAAAGAPGATPAAAGPAPAEIQLSLSITGGYFQVLDFLNRLDALPRLVVTDTLTLSGDNFGRLSTGVTGRMFVNPSAVAPAPGTPGVVTTTTTTVASSTTTSAPPTTAPVTTTTGAPQ